jgi:hypothetical protein
MFSILKNLHLFFVSVIAIIFTLFLNYVILYFFPEIKFYQYFLLLLLYLFAILGFTYKKRQEIINNKIIIEKEDVQYFMYQIPSILNYKFTIVIFIFTLFVGCLSFTSNKTELIIDNGYSKNIEVVINHKDTIIVKANSFEKIDIIRGPLNLVYNQKSHNFNTSSQKYILNIDSKNTYISTNALYTNENQKTIPKQYNTNATIINSEFFLNDFYFVFTDPDDQIFSDKHKNYEVKKVLLRLKK